MAIRFGYLSAYKLYIWVSIFDNFGDFNSTGGNYNTSQVALYNTQNSFFGRAMDLYNTQLSKISRDFYSDIDQGGKGAP